MSDGNDLSRLLTEFTKKRLPPGCGCAVARDGKILYEGYFGLADIENGVPVTEGSVYRLASMTKVIVCTAALMLYERGKFLLNEPLAEYIPAYKKPLVCHANGAGGVEIREAKNPILVKHAFTMGVGLPYGSPVGSGGGAPTWNETNKVYAALVEKYGAGKYTLAQFIDALAAVPLAFEPGDHWLYGQGHDLVARLVEVVSGKTMGQFLKDELFEPLGMTSTAYRHFGDTEKRMVNMYTRDEAGTFTKSPGFLDDLHGKDAVLELGGGGLFSTARDYLAFSQMLACGGEYKGQRYIGRKTIDLMRRNHLSDTQMKDFNEGNGYLAGYGYGLGVRTMMDPAAGHSNSSIGEFGWTGFCGTWTSIDPSERFSAVYMHQMMPNMEEYLHLRVRAAVYGCL